MSMYMDVRMGGGKKGGPPPLEKTQSGGGGGFFLLMKGLFLQVGRPFSSIWGYLFGLAPLTNTSAVVHVYVSNNYKT